MKLILNNAEVKQKIVRMTYEVFERFHPSSRIVIAGIEERGAELGRQVVSGLQKINGAPPVEFISLRLNKDEPVNQPVLASGSLENCRDATVVLIDDVLNSGRTLFFAMQPFMKIEPRNLCVMVLVNRSYRRFPVVAHLVGMHLATTSYEHVRVQHHEGLWEVYLED